MFNYFVTIPLNVIVLWLISTAISLHCIAISSISMPVSLMLIANSLVVIINNYCYSVYFDRCVIDFKYYVIDFYYYVIDSIAMTSWFILLLLLLIFRKAFLFVDTSRRLRVPGVLVCFSFAKPPRANHFLCKPFLSIFGQSGSESLVYNFFGPSDAEWSLLDDKVYCFHWSHQFLLAFDRFWSAYLVFLQMFCSLVNFITISPLLLFHRFVFLFHRFCCRLIDLHCCSIDFYRYFTDLYC